MQKDKAVTSFLEGYNCAQSVVSAFGDQLGLDKKQALKLSTGLGGGINNQGKTCGAVLGSYIILGLRYGVDTADDLEGKQKLRTMLDKFSEEFSDKYKSLDCKGILGMDLSNQEELEELRKKNTFKDFCPEVVETAAKIVERMLKENE